MLIDTDYGRLSNFSLVFVQEKHLKGSREITIKKGLLRRQRSHCLVRPSISPSPEQYHT